MCTPPSLLCGTVAPTPTPTSRRGDPISDARNISLARRIIAPSIILGIGLIPAFYGYKYARRASLKEVCWVHHTGTVVDQVEEYNRMPSDSNNGTIFRAVFQYTDAQGNVRTVKQGAAASWKLYEVGDEVDLLVDPMNREVAVVNSFFELWALPTLFFFFASPFVLLGSVRLVRGVLWQAAPNRAAEQTPIGHHLPHRG